MLTAAVVDERFADQPVLYGCNKEAIDDDALTAAITAGDDMALRALLSRRPRRAA